ncbi:MAG: SAM-dependent methyltransferase [Tannerellaceae bacterium]
MQIISKSNTLREGMLLYRRLRYRKGYGVHSPFVYNLITKVIEEKCSYYSLYDIELLRKKLLFRTEPVSCLVDRKKGKVRRLTVGEVVARKAIQPRHGALLFRLTNYFKSQNILQLGSGMGLSTLYMTSYVVPLRCLVLEPQLEVAGVARQVYGEASRNPIDLRVGAYEELLPQALNDLPRLDFVFFNTPSNATDNEWLFNECVKQVHKDSVFIFEGIKSTARMRTFWKQICGRPEVTVTVDLYDMGLVFFNSKLHKRDYKAYI